MQYIVLVTHQVLYRFNNNKKLITKLLQIGYQF